MKMIPRGPIRTSLTIDSRKLYQLCMKKERELHRKGADGLKADILSTIAFGDVLPINLESAEKYRFLVDLLLKGTHAEARQRVVASWLKQEGICQPHEFLLERDFLDFTAPFAGVLRGIVPSQLRYANIVENWRAYFAALMAKSHELGTGGLEKKARELERLSFVASAIEVVVWQPARSPIAAICRWLAQRTDRRFPQCGIAGGVNHERYRAIGIASADPFDPMNLGISTCATYFLLL
jgi:hypothetical protein